MSLLDGFDKIASELRKGRDPAAVWAEARRTLDYWAASEVDARAYGIEALKLLCELHCLLQGCAPADSLAAWRKMLERGQEEYAAGRDPFRQFREAGEECGTSARGALLVYAHKHKAGVSTYFDGHDSQREPVAGRVIDLSVYVVLDLLMAEAGDAL